MLHKRSQGNRGSRISNGTMTEDQSQSSEKTKVAKERVLGKEATDQRLVPVLDLDIRVIAMLVIVKVVEDVEASKVVAVAEGMNEAVEEAVVDEVGAIASQVEMRTQPQQQRLLKTQSPHQRLRLRLQPPRAVRLKWSRF